MCAAEDVSCHPCPKCGGSFVKFAHEYEELGSAASSTLAFLKCVTCGFNGVSVRVEHGSLESRSSIEERARILWNSERERTFVAMPVRFATRIQEQEHQKELEDLWERCLKYADTGKPFLPGDVCFIAFGGEVVQAHVYSFYKDVFVFEREERGMSGEQVTDRFAIKQARVFFSKEAAEAASAHER